MAPHAERRRALPKTALLLAAAVLAAWATELSGADWPEWRGPARNGVAPASPPLAESWPAGGPRRLWQSEYIPADGRGNLSSPVVAGGRVYVHANWRYTEPILARILTEEKLQELKRGKTVPSAVLAALEQIRGREFATQDDLEKWFAARGITGRTRALAMKQIPVAKDMAHDVLVCLDAASGQVLWKARFPGEHVGVHSSSTPCVADGRCYFLGSHRNVYAIDGETGDLVWSTRTPRGESVSSSFLVADGIAVVLASELVGFNARSGDLLWTQSAVAGTTNSPALWREGGKAYVICNTPRKVACVELQTGRLVWAVAGMKGENSSPAIVGDRMAIQGEDGLAGYRLSPEGAEKLWIVDRVKDHATSPLIAGDHMYVVGGRTLCVEFATGRVAWEHRGGGYISSPLLADGKICGTNNEELFMFRASPEGYVPVGRANLGLVHCASPAFADGKLYLRLEDSVACYDLRAREASAE